LNDPAELAAEFEGAGLLKSPPRGETEGPPKEGPGLGAEVNRVGPLGGEMVLAGMGLVGAGAEKDRPPPPPPPPPAGGLQAPNAES